MRTGLIAHKIGMTQVFQSNGTQVAVTVLKVEPHVILGQRVMEKEKYTAVQIGAGDINVNKVSKPLKGHYAKIGLVPKRHVREFRVNSDSMLPIGSEITVTHFEEGQYVDVTGTSIGKGFAGVMKRHHFGGLRATHGVSLSHRSHGSTGNRQDPGKVFKNKKMAGHMGCERVTTLNLLVQKIDVERGLIFLKGAVPGSKTSRVCIRDAIKKKVTMRGVVG